MLIAIQSFFAWFDDVPPKSGCICIKIRGSLHEKTVGIRRRFFQRSLPLRASEAADAVKLLRSEVCLASVLWANFTSLCAAAQNFTMAQP